MASPEDIKISARNLYREVENILRNVKSTPRSSHRRSKVGDYCWHEFLGFTTNTIGLRGFEEEHNLLSHFHLGRCVTDIESRTNAPLWMREIYGISKKILLLYNPSFVLGKLIPVSPLEVPSLLLFFLSCNISYIYFPGDMVVHVSCMTEKETGSNKIHCDKRDISESYGVYLGEFGGASLHCYDEDGTTELGIIKEPYELFR